MDTEMTTVTVTLSQHLPHSTFTPPGSPLGSWTREFDLDEEDDVRVTDNGTLTLYVTREGLRVTYAPGVWLAVDSQTDPTATNDEN